MAKQYNNTGKSSKQLLGGKGSVVRTIDEFLGSFFFDNPDMTSQLWDEFSGYNSQQREFEQQEYLQDKQNQYNTPAAQMQRFRDAGINPALAAQAVVGGQAVESAQAPAVPSNENGASNALSSLGGVAGNIMSGISAAKQASSAAKQASVAEKLSESQIALNVQNAFKAFKEAGVADWTARSMAIKYFYLDYNEQIDLMLKIATYDETKARYQNLVAEHENILAHYDEILANIDVLEAQKGLVEANAAKAEAEKGKIEEEKRWMQAENDFWENEGYLRSNPNHEALRNAEINGKKENAEKIGNAIYEGKYQESKAIYNADPYQKEVQEAFESISQYDDMISEDEQLLKQLEQAVDSGQISSSDFVKYYNRVQNEIDEMKRNRKELEKVVQKNKYSMGHHSAHQDLLNGLGHFGISVSK